MQNVECRSLIFTMDTLKRSDTGWITFIAASADVAKIETTSNRSKSSICSSRAMFRRKESIRSARSERRVHNCASNPRK